MATAPETPLGRPTDLAHLLRGESLVSSALAMTVPQDIPTARMPTAAPDTSFAKESGPAATRRMVHMHIPKTAGTALRTAFGKVTDRKLRIFPHYDERQVLNANPAEWDVISGHFGYKTASQLDGDIITVLRHPVDRFVSVYYFWRELLEKNVEVTRKTRLTHSFSLDEFVCLHDELLLIEEFFNRMTWQVAYGSSMEHRKELRNQGKTENEMLALAVRNLGSFALVGLQNRMPDFSREVERRFGMKLNVGRINVTESRPSVDDISMATRRRIYDWVYLDLELYEAAARLAGRAG